MAELELGAFRAVRQELEPVAPPAPAVGERDELVSLVAALGTADSARVGQLVGLHGATHRRTLRLVCSPCGGRRWEPRQLLPPRPSLLGSGSPGRGHRAAIRFPTSRLSI